MFFTLSKLVWFAFSPVNMAILLAALAALLAFTRFARPARWLGLASLVALGLMAFSPLPRIVMLPLENRFPQQDAAKGPVDGIIILGGAIGVARGDVVLTSAAARMTKAVELARLHPKARIVFAGGAANLISPVTPTLRPMAPSCCSKGWGWSRGVSCWKTSHGTPARTRSSRASWSIPSRASAGFW
jgi:uncharacterized SAM-binding protein YcdF (DUF218 family)